MAGAEHATLRGAAFLAGSDGLFWGGLRETRATLPEGETFMPSIGDDERQARRARWLAVAEQEIDRAASQAAREGRQDA
jgi:glycerol kinase